MKYDLQMYVQTNTDMTSWDIGKKFLSPLFNNEKLAPQRVSTFGEVTTRCGFDVEGMKECRAYWASKATMRVDGALDEFTVDFNWKRLKSIKSEGYVDFIKTTNRGKKIPGRISFRSKYRKEVDWIALFINWCKITTPFAAILHPINAEKSPVDMTRDVRDFSYTEEVAENAWSRFLSGELYSEFRAGELNSMVLGLTNLGWASWFGGKYFEEINEAEIAAAGFPIQKIGNGYLVQVTEDINDVVNDFPMFSKRRAELKSLFRDDLFLIKDEPIVN